MNRFTPVKILVILVLIYVLACIFARLVSEGMVFLPPPSSYGETAPDLIFIPTDDPSSPGLAAMHLRNPDAKYLFLHFHGNGEDIGMTRWWLEQARAEGFEVLAVDYRGYGLSGGTPTERAYYADSATVVAHCRDKLGWKPERIIVHGRSLGGAAAARIAARNPVAALIVENAFVSAYRVMTVKPVLLGDRFETIDDIMKPLCPVLVIYSKEDEVVGAWNGPALFASAPEPKQLWAVEGAGHNDLLSVTGDRYWERIRAFVDGLPPQP
jgi:pimeloyl-ACP methyl ester carboxylesterase